MKSSCFYLVMLLMCLGAMPAIGQVKYQPGRPQSNDPDNKMNRMIGSDDTGFYCYRIRSRGKGTDFYVEKYDSKTLDRVFSKVLSFENTEHLKIEDVKLLKGKVYIFTRTYETESNLMTLHCQTISDKGEALTNNEIAKATSDHYQFVDFDIYPNPSETKILVKVCHKANRDDEFKTDFKVIGLNGLTTQWTKSVKQRLIQTDIDDEQKKSVSVFNVTYAMQTSGMVGLYFDDNDDVCYAYTAFNERTTKNEEHKSLHLACIKANSDKPVDLLLPFDKDYKIGNIRFAKTNSQLVVGGFYKDITERTGRDLVQCGVFSFNIDLASLAVVTKSYKDFTPELTGNLDLTIRRSKNYAYKMDYIFQSGGDTYYVGEQYNQFLQVQASQYGATSSNWVYRYMDVIVAKQNARGEFEWFKNLPLHVSVKLADAHVFKQYFAVATANNIYVMHNENPDNTKLLAKGAGFRPDDVKDNGAIHGSNFVYTSISFKDGSVERGVVFVNDDYCFAPIQEKNPRFYPPNNSEIFVASKQNPNEYFIYTEDRGNDRFGKLLVE